MPHVRSKITLLNRERACKFCNCWFGVCVHRSKESELSSCLVREDGGVSGDKLLIQDEGYREKSSLFWKNNGNWLCYYPKSLALGSFFFLGVICTLQIYRV